MKIAINGFGRIGRAVAKVAIEKNIDIVAINDLADAKTLAHLLKYDSTYGKFPAKVEAKKDAIIVNGKAIKVFAQRDITNLPWAKLGVDIAIESTGIFRLAKSEKGGYLDHIDAGAKRVILTVPAKDEIDQTIVLGVNSAALDASKLSFSNASCTTNCLAPVAKIVEDNFGIEKAFMTTIHAYTSDQVLIDRPHSDLRRARAAGRSIIPTTTGATIAVEKVIPTLKGKLDGCSMRVPIITGSLVDFTVKLKKGTTAEQINQAVKKAAESSLQGILEYTEDKIVSVDIIQNTHSCIFDADSTQMIGDDFAKLVIWYDNEWGYSNRVVELAQKLGEKL